MKLNRKVILMLFMAIFMTSTFAMIRTVHAATLNVPSGLYPTITAAIAAAAGGDTILVAAGVYNEQITINKPLTITGAGAATTTITVPARLGEPLSSRLTRLEM